MKNKRYLLFAIGFLFLLGCKQQSGSVLSPTTLPKPTEISELIVTPKPTEIPEPTVIPESTTIPNPPILPEPTATPEPTAPPMPTGMPKSRVVVADPDVERIPISEEFFSGQYFRGYINEVIDEDGDGFLTKQEREQVTGICFVDFCYENYDLSEDINVVDGLNWFPNIEAIQHEGGQIFEIYLDHHPGVKSLESSEAWRGSVYFIDGCDKLENIWFCSNGAMALYVNNCKNLKYIDGYEYGFSSLYVSECPNTRIMKNLTVGLSKKCYLDDAIQVIWATSDFNDDLEERYIIDGAWIRISEDGSPWYEDYALEEIQWLGNGVERINLSGQIEQILAMQETAVPKELIDADKVNTNLTVIMVSPRKPSIYYAESQEKDIKLYWEYLAKKYYVAEANGTISAYNSFEELCTAAKEIEGLEDLSQVLKERRK